MPAAAGGGEASSGRHHLPPRHLETLLQALVRNNVLKGVRGPRGGYELGRERRKITAGDIVRAVMLDMQNDDSIPAASSALVSRVIEPIIDNAGRSFLAELDTITVEDLCRDAESISADAAASKSEQLADFAI